jgi:hypothetical protein
VVSLAPGVTQAGRGVVGDLRHSPGARVVGLSPVGLGLRVVGGGLGVRGPLRQRTGQLGRDALGLLGGAKLCLADGGARVIHSDRAGQVDHVARAPCSVNVAAIDRRGKVGLGGVDPLDSFGQCSAMLSVFRVVSVTIVPATLVITAASSTASPLRIRSPYPVGSAFCTDATVMGSSPR